MDDFVAFRKIPRLFREVVVTEKIDGTNACIRISAEGAVIVQSRKRVITPEDDDRRLSVVIEGEETAPRTITATPQPLAELVGRQLSDRDRDPIFRKTMEVAQALALSVLGA